MPARIDTENWAHDNVIHSKIDSAKNSVPSPTLQFPAH